MNTNTRIRRSRAADAPARTRPQPSRFAARALACAILGIAGTLADAAQPTPAAPDAQSLIESFVKAQFGPEYRVELRFGPMNPGLKLAPCERIEPFLPPAVRLWGRTTIGVRCTQGAQWSVAVPMTVAVFGPALVADRPIPPNTPVGAADVRVQEVELSRERQPALTDPSQLAGLISTRALSPGQTLREYYFRVLPAVRPGDPVRIRLMGPGFVVMSDGAAMASAGEGQTVRVRTASGKIMLGTVKGRSVEVKL